MARPLIILGTGGNAYDVLDIVDAINASAPAQQQWEVAGFLDDARAAGCEFLGRPIVGRLTEAGRFSRESFVNAIGSDASYRRRESIIASTGLAEDRFATLVHPGAAVSSRSRLGRGTYVNYGASIAGNVNISAHVAVGPGCIVGHDGSIGAFSMLAPGAIVSGFVQIGRSVYVGAGAMLRQRLSVGDGALVGMGAVVLRDVAQGSVVVGNPARPMAKGADRT